MGFDLGGKINSLVPSAGPAATPVGPTVAASQPSQPEPNPIDDPDLFDVVELGGVESPGVVKITGHDRKVNWDVKAGSGQSGATTTLKDIPPVEITLTIYMADDDDFDDWPAFREQVKSTISGPKPKALEIYHPDLASQGITSVCQGTMGGIVHDGKGGRTVVIKLQEYKPPKKKTGSPSGSSSKTSAPDPNAAALAQLAALTAQYKATP